MQTITQRMDYVRDIFETYRRIGETQEYSEKLLFDIDEVEFRFRSIAYEGLSMGIALRDIQNDKLFSDWKKYYALNRHHSSQIFIGLGWAIANSELTVFAIDSVITFSDYSLIADGCGYYMGMFKQRSTVKGKQLPFWLSEEYYSGFFQGIGRSLWYSTKADVIKIAEIIKSFSQPNQSDLWRGVGIACSYIGGCSAEMLQLLLVNSKEHRYDLLKGANQVKNSRTAAGTADEEINTVLNYWS